MGKLEVPARLRTALKGTDQVRRVRAALMRTSQAVAERAPKRSAAIFNHFTPFEGRADGYYEIDFFGQRTDPAVRHGVIQPVPRGPIRVDPPEIDSQYPEWVFLLECVTQLTAEGMADRPLVFGELGAGWGPWLVTAKLAVRQLAPCTDVQLLGVEADEAHFGFLREHLNRNGVLPGERVLHNAAVHGANGDVDFDPLDDPAGPYGQRILEGPASERGTVRVRGRTFRRLTEGIDRVDYLTVDIQGGELALVRTSLPDLTEKVRYLQIATHNAEIHREVRDRLAAAGWQSRFDFPFQRLARTPWGLIRFEDGSQAWVNPRLAEPAR